MTEVKAPAKCDDFASENSRRAFLRVISRARGSDPRVVQANIPFHNAAYDLETPHEVQDLCRRLIAEGYAQGALTIYREVIRDRRSGSAWTQKDFDALLFDMSVQAKELIETQDPEDFVKSLKEGRNSPLGTAERMLQLAGLYAPSQGLSADFKSGSWLGDVVPVVWRYAITKIADLDRDNALTRVARTLRHCSSVPKERGAHLQRMATYLFNEMSGPQPDPSAARDVRVRKAELPGNDSLK